MATLPGCRCLTIALSLSANHFMLQGLRSPLIAEDEGAGVKELKLRFDVSQYTPEEIMVKTVDNKLLVPMNTTMIVL